MTACIGVHQLDGGGGLLTSSLCVTIRHLDHARLLLHEPGKEGKGLTDQPAQADSSHRCYYTHSSIPLQLSGLIRPVWNDPFMNCDDRYGLLWLGMSPWPFVGNWHSSCNSGAEEVCHLALHPIQVSKYVHILYRTVDMDVLTSVWTPHCKCYSILEPVAGKRVGITSILNVEFRAVKRKMVYRTCRPKLPQLNNRRQSCPAWNTIIAFIVGVKRLSW